MHTRVSTLRRKAASPFHKPAKRRATPLYGAYWNVSEGRSPRHHPPAEISRLGTGQLHVMHASVEDAHGHRIQSATPENLSRNHSHAQRMRHYYQSVKHPIFHKRQHARSIGYGLNEVFTLNCTTVYVEKAPKQACYHGCALSQK